MGRKEKADDISSLPAIYHQIICMNDVNIVILSQEYSHPKV